jgi:hypothetical protein
MMPMVSQATGLPATAPVLCRIPVDAHVHFHDRRHVAATLAAATANFRALEPAGASPVRGALLLGQSATERIFEWLRDQPGVGDWSVTPVPAEAQCVWLRSVPGEILVVCGRQVVAEPGLEVLALGTDRRIEDGLGLERTLQLAESADALAVLPWGFGKWTGRCKRRVREAIASRSVGKLWVGDNGGRLSLLPRPRLLDEAEAHGRGILPGTDPFPFGGDYRRVGSFGCLLETRLDPARPWAAIRAALARTAGSPQAYGRGAGVLEFGVRQAWMQVRKRLNGRPA